MRIGFISDTHGNFIALKAVLADLKTQGPDLTIFLGDATTIGSHPKETLDMLRELACHAYIMGNHDEAVLYPERASDLQIAPNLHDSLQWTIEQLSRSDLDFLRSFQQTFTLELGGPPILCFHGSPLSNTAVLTATSPAELLEEHFSGQPSSIWIGGHTHVQLHRRHGTKLLINSGSVGNAFKHAFVPGKPPELLPWAEYALIEIKNTTISVNLKRVPFDTQKVLGMMASCGNPAAPWWLEQYK